ncbi:MAG: hypothetical protein GY696_16450 [Gammaproteobacteria bacterium]|nr:hypothetical protein [Gammaproteobacteria bacterium]
MSCNCDTPNTEKLFRKKEFIIPLETGGLRISGKGKSIHAEYNGFASLELQVAIDNLLLVSLSEKSVCQITPYEIKGCYSCLTGAKLQYSCKTDYGDTLAHITCGAAAFSTRCTVDGFRDTVTMMFQKVRIQETCTVICSGGSSKFNINATLAFIDKGRLGTISNIVGESQGESGNSKIDYGFLTDWFAKDCIRTLFIILLAIAAVLLSIFFGPMIVQYLSSIQYLNCIRKFKNSKQPTLSKPVSHGKRNKPNMLRTKIKGS